MRRLSLLPVVVLAIGAASGVALADAPPWNYVEAGYNNIDVNNLSEKGDGWFAGASFSGRTFHVFGRYVNNTTDDTDFDVNRWFAGAGWHGGLGERGDIYVDAAYVDADFGSASQSGYFVRGGIRYRILKFLEVGGNYRYEDIGDFGSDRVYELNGTFYVWRIGLGVNWEKADEVETYSGFVRLNF